MTRRGGIVLALVCLAQLLTFSLAAAVDPSHQVYVVHMGAKCDKHESQIRSEHHDMLAAVMGSVEDARDSIIYHYHRSFRGFAATMASHHADSLKGHDQVHNVFLSKAYVPQTTHSWQFLGVSGPDGANLPTGTAYQYPNFTAQNDVIIGVLDTGYWPESASFHDRDMPPPPARWRGQCIPGENFTADTCNNKVIGARHYYHGLASWLAANNQSERYVVTDLLSARDKVGHGTHCASIAAGRNVSGVSVYGVGLGTAVGGAPGARLAIYKVCNQLNSTSTPVLCGHADILGAFDDAIADGVDVLSVSIKGSAGNETLFDDSMAMGSFYAATHNVLVAAAAGNQGPSYSTVGNTPPWMLTVASSTTDRKFVTNVELGDGTIIPGFGVINPYVPFSSNVPIIEGANSPSNSSYYYSARFCYSGSLDSSLLTGVSGAIVICQRSSEFLFWSVSPWPAREVLRAGGVGIIFVGGDDGSPSFPLPLPGTSITYETAQALYRYFNTTSQPVGKILTTQALLGYVPAPVISEFSSRGPSFRNPDILKPDITGPGQDILAAYSPLAVDSYTGNRSLDWNVVSGTSMSTPHLSGIAALIKAVHPDWSPAAIKSAIMTTATQHDNTMTTSNYSANIKGYPDMYASPLSYGAGHVRPSKALDPGLVYDTPLAQYTDFLCNGFNLTSAQLQVLTRDPAAACPAVLVPHYNLNYPTISISRLAPTGNTVVRTLTNVGPSAVATYTSYLWVPYYPYVIATVEPAVLQFTELGQKLSFTVTFQPNGSYEAKPLTGQRYWWELEWSDGVHTVTSQFLVTTVVPDSTECGIVC